MDYYQFIEDENELEWFWRQLPRLEKSESYYFCMAARGKKLSEEDKKKYEMGRSEMFYPQIMSYKPDWKFSDFLKNVCRFQVDKRAFLTKNDLSYPDNSLICYFDPNPCSEIDCLFDYKSYMQTIESELIKAVQKGSDDGISEQMSKLSRSIHHYKTCHPQHHSRSIWVNYDFDFKYENPGNRDIIEFYVWSIFKRFFPKDGYLVIRTSNGVHVLLKTECISSYNKKLKDSGDATPDSYFKPAEFGRQLFENESLCRDSFKEIEKTKNGFIPLPGTRHYLKNGDYITVEVINKDGFKEA